MNQNNITIMKKFLCKCFLAILLLVAAKPVYAGFPIGQGRWLLVPTYTHYSAENYWDANRVLTPAPNGERFTSNYFGLFGGFGIGRDLDLVFNIPYITNTRTQNNAIVEQFSGLGDVSLGLSYFLNHFDYYKHLSVTASILVPGYSNIPNTFILPGFASIGTEVKLGFCGTNTTNLKNSYYDLEAGIRHYFNTGGPTQFFGNATLGAPLDDNWKISGTLNYVNSTSKLGNSAVPVLNPNLNRDFDFLRGNLSLGYRLNRNMSLWGSIFSDFLGRNIGQGRGLSIYMVIKL